MLVSNIKDRIKVRSTKKLNDKGIAKIAETVGSFESIQRYDRQHVPKRGRRTFPFLCLIMFCIYLEIMGLTYDADISQNKLKAMGMPYDRTMGTYLRPSPARISHFINHEWPLMRDPVSSEYVSSILDSIHEKRFTVDSTPMEASRYSLRYHFSPHYNIRMGKCHIIMCNGYPLVCTFTDANESDSLELPKLLDLLPSHIDGVKEFTSDGAYASFSNYSSVFSRLNVVMASNIAKNSVFHEERSWEYIEGLYSRQWKEEDYRSKASPSSKLNFLTRKGFEEPVGKFLRNLDMSRGKRISNVYARSRHVCETVHHAMKRWMAFDVRGLRRESDAQRKSFRFFTAQVLCAIFDPYVEC
jgi:hypothetical protein